MEPKNCPRCGKIFVQLSETLCKDCVKIEEAIYETVRQYVRDNPNSSINEVSVACDVPVKRVMAYIRDGRLHATPGMQDDILCSKCGKPILMGRMCEKCILDVNFKVKDMKDASKFKNMGKIHTQQ